MAKKQKDTNLDVVSILYPTLPTSDDIKPKTDPDKPDVAALQAEIATLKQQIKTQDTDRTLANLSVAPSEPPRAPMFGQEPDRTAEPDKYADYVVNKEKLTRDYNDRLNAYRQAELTKFNERTNALWEGFREAHGEYAADEEKVRYVAAKVVERAQKMGVDINAYMFGNANQFAKDVMARYDKDFGKPKPASGDGDGDEGGDGEDGDDIRTMGLPGGTQSGGKPTGTAAGKAGDQLGSLVADIKDFQQKTGFN